MRRGRPIGEGEEVVATYHNVNLLPARSNSTSSGLERLRGCCELSLKLAVNSLNVFLSVSELRGTVTAHPLKIILFLNTKPHVLLTTHTHTLHLKYKKNVNSNTSFRVIF